MLKERLQQDMIESMKAGNAIKRLVLSLVNSAIKNKELEKRTKLSKSGTDADKFDELSKLSDEEIMDVISLEVKKRKESIESYNKAGREELAQKERDELNILMEYMPEQISEGAVKEEVKKVISEIGAKEMRDMGKVLSALMPKLKGRADGQMISKIVKEELSL